MLHNKARTIKPLLLMLLFLSLLAGCGKKGPLYLPQPEKTTQNSATMEKINET